MVGIMERSDGHREWVALAVVCAVGCAVDALLLGGVTAAGAITVTGLYRWLWPAVAVGMLCAVALAVKSRGRRRDPVT